MGNLDYTKDWIGTVLQSDSLCTSICSWQQQQQNQCKEKMFYQVQVQWVLFLPLVSMLMFWAVTTAAPQDLQISGYLARVIEMSEKWYATGPVDMLPLWLLKVLLTTRRQPEWILSFKKWSEFWAKAGSELFDSFHILHRLSWILSPPI